MDSTKSSLPFLTTFLLTSLVFKPGVDFDRSRGSGMSAESNQARTTVYRVSRHEVRYFVDRPEMLAQIDRRLEEDTRAPKTVVLQGMGGQGKTQLALRYCNRARSRRCYDYIFWVDASTKASTTQDLKEIYEELGGNDQDKLDSDAQIAFVRRKLTADSLSWLLIFDNYDDPSIFDLREYMPPGPRGNVLITSRSLDAERIGPTVHLSGMAESEAMELLLKQVDTTKDETSRSAAADIVRRLGYLPLAIDQAGAYIKAEDLSLTNFLSHYEQSSRDILESVPSLWEYTESVLDNDGQKTAVAKTVFTTWNLSFTLLMRSNRDTGPLKTTILSLLAFFDEHKISEEHFKDYWSLKTPNQPPEWLSLFTDEEDQWSSRKFDRVMREFSRLSLITSLDTSREETEYASVSLHPLIRDWINLRQEKDTHRENFIMFSRLLAASLSGKFSEPASFLFKMNFVISDIQYRNLTRHIRQ
ncbi:P-loop containing nucleoside triphosphate hydrolase protein [Xylariaceae sp. FL0662B]|nr:P-loop containing nucleoside triphosphate hydrolase protein [Xylariaceae sp. FL0662B]